MIYNILSRDVFIRSSKKDLEKRQFTLHMTYFAEEPDNFPRVKPLLVFKAQPSGYDDEDSDWEGDVECAPYLDSNERNDCDDRVFVIYSTKAYMGRQQCKWYVKKVLEIIGDDNISLQVDGYKSMVNALETEDKDGHIFELISPGDCTDLCSMPDCSVGAFVKGKINKYFDTDCDKRPNDYVDGKVTAREMRTLYTKLVADAVQDLYENHKPLILDAFEKTGVCIDMDGFDKGKSLFLTFLPSSSRKR